MTDELDEQEEVDENTPFQRARRAMYEIQHNSEYGSSQKIIEFQVLRDELNARMDSEVTQAILKAGGKT